MVKGLVLMLCSFVYVLFLIKTTHYQQFLTTGTEKQAYVGVIEAGLKKLRGPNSSITPGLWSCQRGRSVWMLRARIILISVRRRHVVV